METSLMFDFPTSPSNGQNYTSGGRTFVYNGYAWDLQGDSYTKSQADTKFVDIAGDTMTGTLSISGAGINLPAVQLLNLGSHASMYGNNSAFVGQATTWSFNNLIGSANLGTLDATGWKTVKAYAMFDGGGMSVDLAYAPVKYLSINAPDGVSAFQCGDTTDKANFHYGEYHYFGNRGGAVGHMNADGTRLFITPATASTSTTTGALLTNGGAGIGGALHCGLGIGIGVGYATSPGLGNTNVGINLNSTGYVIASRSNAPPVYCNINVDGTIQSILRSGVQCGAINVTATTTTYASGSDGRLKEDLQPFDAGAIIDATEVYDFRWKEVGERAFGVVAQDAAEIYPMAVVHDEKQDWWGIDYSKYVPILLQELKALRARVAELEGRKRRH